MTSHVMEDAPGRILRSAHRAKGVEMFFETGDGTRLAYEDYGQGRPIVFAASWTLSGEMWEYQLPVLVEHGYRCITVDRRGHGRSDRPSGGYDLDTGADDLAALLDHLDVRDAVLVGHSAGGAEISRYLARHGEHRVAGAVFVSTVLPFLKATADNPDGVPEAALHATLRAFRTDRAQWFARQAQVWFATHLNDVSAATIDHTVAQCLATSPWAGAALFESLFHQDHREDLRKISVPALVVHGTVDSSAPVALTGRRTADLIPGATFKEYPTASHGLFITHKEQLNADLLEFVGSC
ncbi:alpha/beta fold hydrolase [Streptomyces longispororuber]|uniref:alpha/beta fold hydrolase n=1 Tax=Streptomyces longispororuber TaxID=68230 RepID=UPI00210A2549|nr:alpha/beta hydrolase [Streptomyces longispororuber]MCQ4210581.1 alpha/beta hydrolase [Streptomyces longispororuber]